MATDNISITDKYDPNRIIQIAQSKLQQENDVEGAQMIFQSALLEWVDDAREMAQTHHDPDGIVREAVATLWLAYAHFLVNAQQFKSATETYEQAVQCPVAGSVGRVWLDYARFAEDRGKLKTAQNVYLRALVGDGTGAVTDEQDQELLWMEFLEMMRKANPDLTMEELKIAIETEHLSGNMKVKEEQIEDGGNARQNIDQADARPLKRLKLEDGEPITDLNKKTHLITSETVEAEATSFAEVVCQRSLPPDMAAAWMVRDGTDAPQPPEPPLFQPSPPKLSDPTAKDILGVELSLQLIARLLDPSGSLLLEVCRGLWTMQGLKEKEAAKAIDMVDQTMIKEYERLEKNLDARLAVAGAAHTAVQQMNQNERMTFQTTCSQQRQNLLTGIAWEFRQIQCVQQQILTKLNVPGFHGPTVDASDIDLQAKICSYLHSAFYLRNRIGEDPHIAMLKTQLKRLQAEFEKAGAMQQNHQQNPADGQPFQMPSWQPQENYGYMMQQQPPQYMQPMFYQQQQPGMPLMQQNPMQAPPPGQYGNQGYPYFQ